MSVVVVGRGRGLQAWRRQFNKRRDEVSSLYALRRRASSSAWQMMGKEHVLDALAKRGMLHQVTAPNSLRSHLASAPRVLYTGVDPSADSLHVGNLLPLFAAIHFVRHGHTALLLVGGATGMIGDPSGRNAERKALSDEQVRHNVAMITQQIQSFFRRAKEQSIANGLDALNDSDMLERIQVVNNAEFYKEMSVIAFLRDVGKFARVTSMMARDSVKSRLLASDGRQTGQGLSFTEFSYQLLQAYDFSVLHRPPWSCTVQLGGSDQMGNIMAGVDLIRRQKALDVEMDAESDAEKIEDEQLPAYGVTLPLLTTSSGAKFGKSAGNAVWLASSKCSHYDFYQYFYRARDDEVERYLHTLTLLPLEVVNSIMSAHRARPALRSAQRALADHITELVRGQDGLRKARVATRVLFDTSLDGMTTDEVVSAFEDDPRLKHIPKQDLFADSMDILQLATRLGLTRSRSEARRAILNGGLYLNNVAVQDHALRLDHSHILPHAQIIILRLGSKEHAIVALH